MRGVFKYVTDEMWWAVCTVAVVAALALCNMRPSSGGGEAESARFLVHEAVKWHDASRQDSSEVLRARHSAFAVAYLTAARMLASDETILGLTGVDARRTLKEYNALLSSAKPRAARSRQRRPYDE